MAKIIHVRFYQSNTGKEPVKTWLLEQNHDDRRIIGSDIKSVEYGWPLGMPFVRKLKSKLWEVRSNISDGRIARVLFTIHEGQMILLHGFVKKTQKTPSQDFDLAMKRLASLYK